MDAIIIIKFFFLTNLFIFNLSILTSKQDILNLFFIYLCLLMPLK